MPTNWISWLMKVSALVVINSVVQYFPSTDYLLQVLKHAVRASSPGGNIFIGDVRSLPMLRTYHASVQLYKASPEMPLEELQRRISKAQQSEEELALDPDLFYEIADRWQRVGRLCHLLPGAVSHSLAQHWNVVLLQRRTLHGCIGTADAWVFGQ